MLSWWKNSLMKYAHTLSPLVTPGVTHFSMMMSSAQSQITHNPCATSSTRLHPVLRRWIWSGNISHRLLAVCTTVVADSHFTLHCVLYHSYTIITFKSPPTCLCGNFVSDAPVERFLSTFNTVCILLNIYACKWSKHLRQLDRCHHASMQI